MIFAATQLDLFIEAFIGNSLTSGVHPETVFLDCCQENFVEPNGDGCTLLRIKTAIQRFNHDHA